MSCSSNSTDWHEIEVDDTNVLFTSSIPLGLAESAAKKCSAKILSLAVNDHTIIDLMWEGSMHHLVVFHLMHDKMHQFQVKPHSQGTNYVL